jgi:hypothetical protein
MKRTSTGAPRDAVSTARRDADGSSLASTTTIRAGRTDWRRKRGIERLNASGRFRVATTISYGEGTAGV